MLETFRSNQINFLFGEAYLFPAFCNNEIELSQLITNLGNDEVKVAAFSSGFTEESYQELIVSLTSISKSEERISQLRKELISDLLSKIITDRGRLPQLSPRVKEYIKALSRRRFLKRSAVAGAGAVGVIKVLSSLFSDKLNLELAPADLSSYKPMPWGRGEIDSDDIRTLNYPQLKEKIKNPKMALSWMIHVKRYNQALELGRLISYSEVYAKQLMGIRSRPEEIHFNMHNFEIFEALVGDYAVLNSRGYVALFRGNNDLSYDYREASECEDTRVYTNLILMSTLSDQEKIVELKKPREKRSYFPFSTPLPPMPPGNRRRLNNLFKAYRFYRPSFGHDLYKCEDIALTVIDLLIDDGYPPLCLVMSRQTTSGKTKGHIVYIVKGRQGYGFLGFNPVMASKPKYPTIRTLMTKEFPGWGRCLVLDYQKTGILTYLNPKKYNSGKFYPSVKRLVDEIYKVTLPVSKYPD